MKTQYKGRNHLKGGRGHGQFADLRGSLMKKRWVVFLSGVDTSMKTMCIWSK